jgi:hypothetical protein
MDRAHERILGTLLVFGGVAILLFSFVTAYGMLVKLNTASGSTTAPDAAFAYSINGYTVTLTDESHPGSTPITATYWSFSDGNTSAQANTTHTYTRAGAFNVTLAIEDRNGNVEESAAIVHVGTGATGTGVGTPSVSPIVNAGSAVGALVGGTLSGVVKIAETTSLLLVMFLVGAAILKAGWNLITPKAETISVRVRPKDLQIEGVGYSAMPAAAPAAVARPPAASARPMTPTTTGPSS